jgi:hypothetical protein
MSQKPKARKGTGKAKGKSRSKNEGSEKTQSERFVEAARAIGVDESGKEFERALTRLTPPKVATKTKRKDA